MMDVQQQEPTNGQVLAGAAVSAAILAALAVAIGRRRDRESSTIKRVAPDSAAATVTGLAETTRDAGRRLADAAPDSIEAVAKRTREAGRRGRRRAERLAAGLNREALADMGASASAEVANLRRGARRAAGRGGEKGHEVTDRAKRQAQHVGEQTTSTAQSVAAQAAAAAVSGAERARSMGFSLADAAKERVPQATQKVSDEIIPALRGKVGDEVVPTLRDVAVQAASTAIDLWQTARERAVEVASGDGDLPVSKASRVIETGSDRAREASAAVAEQAGQLGERVRGATRQTARATVDTGKDTGALLFWAGAAAGLVFYALLTPERREQLTRTVQAVTGEIQELVRDFQGYDDEF